MLAVDPDDAQLLEECYVLVWDLFNDRAGAGYWHSVTDRFGDVSSESSKPRPQEMPPMATNDTIRI